MKVYFEGVNNKQVYVQKNERKDRMNMISTRVITKYKIKFETSSIMNNDVAMWMAVGTEKITSQKEVTMLGMLYAMLLLGDVQTVQVTKTKDHRSVKCSTT